MFPFITLFDGFELCSIDYSCSCVKSYLMQIVSSFDFRLRRRKLETIACIPVSHLRYIKLTASDKTWIVYIEYVVVAVQLKTIKVKGSENFTENLHFVIL